VFADVVSGTLSQLKEALDTRRREMQTRVAPAERDLDELDGLP